MLFVSFPFCRASRGWRTTPTEQMKLHETLWTASLTKACRAPRSMNSASCSWAAAWRRLSASCWDVDALEVLLPELKPMIGFEQESRYHDMTTDEHTFTALDAAAAMHLDLRVRLSRFSTMRASRSLPGRARTDACTTTKTWTWARKPMR